MINLKRRPERRVKMEKCFTELGIDYKIFDAVDGRLVSLYAQKLAMIKLFHTQCYFKKVRYILNYEW